MLGGSGSASRPPGGCGWSAGVGPVSSSDGGCRGLGSVRAGIRVIRVTGSAGFSGLSPAGPCGDLRMVCVALRVLSLGWWRAVTCVVVCVFCGVMSRCVRAVRRDAAGFAVRSPGRLRRAVFPPPVVFLRPLPRRPGSPDGWRKAGRAGAVDVGEGARRLIVSGSGRVPGGRRAAGRPILALCSNRIFRCVRRGSPCVPSRMTTWMTCTPFTGCRR